MLSSLEECESKLFSLDVNIGLYFAYSTFLSWSYSLSIFLARSFTNLLYFSLLLIFLLSSFVKFFLSSSNAYDFFPVSFSNFYCIMSNVLNIGKNKTLYYSATFCKAISDKIELSVNVKYSSKDLNYY